MRWLLALLAACFFLGSGAYAASSAPPALFQTQAAAQTHCPNDIVVWLNVPTGIYHFQGQRWFGSTKNGAYTCKQEADAAGDRPTKNGQ